MKKFISVVLALMMVFSMFATASALTVADYITSTDEYFLSYTLPVDIVARRSGASDYVASPLSIVDSNLPNGIGVDFMATLDMEQLRTFFSKSLPIIYKQLDSPAKAEFDSGVVSTEVTVTIEYAGATVANPSTAGSLTSGNTIFEQDGDRVTNGNTATIKFKNSALTVAQLMENNATYLQDVVFTLADIDAAVYNTEGDYEVTVTFSGETVLDFETKDIKVEYAESVAKYTVSTDIPSTGGGGSSSLTIKLNTNGGTGAGNITVRRGAKAQLPTPVRDGYVFEGWYTDSNFTTPFDATQAIYRNYTLYAKWVEDNGSAGNGHETPEILNGEDHFAYVVGYPDATVRPNDNISRAEVTSIFFRLLKESVRNENLTSSNNFGDVNDDDWYNTAVSTMANLGIVNGRTADEFVPNAFITRAEFAAICARVDDSEFEIVDNFADVSGHWAEAEILEAAAYGWIRGYEDNTFKPDRFITRAEAMTMINRVLNRVPETVNDLSDNMKEWADNSDESEWYYLPVQEATNGHNYDMKNRIYEKWTALNETIDWTKYE